jgi:hypothetical protein
VLVPSAGALQNENTWLLPSLDLGWSFIKKRKDVRPKLQPSSNVSDPPVGFRKQTAIHLDTNFGNECSAGSSHFREAALAARDGAPVTSRHPWARSAGR